MIILKQFLKILYSFTSDIIESDIWTSSDQ